jgi:hypothetical protein
LAKLTIVPARSAFVTGFSTQIPIFTLWGAARGWMLTPVKIKEHQSSALIVFDKASFVAPIYFHSRCRAAGTIALSGKSLGFLIVSP